MSNSRRRVYFAEYHRKRAAQKRERYRADPEPAKARSRAFFRKNAQAIKLARSLAIPLRYARDLVSRAAPDI